MKSKGWFNKKFYTRGNFSNPTMNQSIPLTYVELIKTYTGQHWNLGFRFEPFETYLNNFQSFTLFYNRFSGGLDNHLSFVSLE